jgi:elongation factor G
MTGSYKIEQLRNVVFLGHGSSGKTSLAEAMLYDAGAIPRLGRVEEGNTVSDYDDEEIRRKISLSTSLLPMEWEGHKINILDAPGYADFIGEMKEAVRVADAVIIVLDAVAGVEVGTEMVWGFADERHLPRFVIINKMDRENANFHRAMEQLADRFASRFVALQLPIGSQSDFRGVIDLVSMKAYMGGADRQDTAGEIPEELMAEAQEARQALVEAAAEGDDELIVKYLEGEELSEEEIRRGLAAAVAAGNSVLVLCSSALLNLGIQRLLSAIVAYLPSPVAGRNMATNPATGEEVALTTDPAGPLAVLAFKTLADPYVGRLTYFRVYSGTLVSDSRVFNSRSGEEERIGQLYTLRGKEQKPVDSVGVGDLGAIAKLSTTVTGDTLCDKGHPLVLPGIVFPRPTFFAAIEPKTKADLDKMGIALPRLIEEDPTLKLEREPSTGETILSGMGESHVDIAARRLQQKFGVGINVKIPKVPYRETITKVAQVQGRHKKQTGGRGQFGDVFIRFEPLPRGSGFEFVDEVFGGAVPRQYIPAVEKGLREIIQHGVLAGYPAVDFRAALYNGSYHPVDSSELAFKLAAHIAFKKGMEQAGVVLLEPIMNVTITVPNEFTGDVMGDLNTRRGRVQGMEQGKGTTTITAQVPMAEMRRYSTDLRSITQGRGLYTMELSHYEEVPSHIAQQVIEEAKKEAG